MPCANSAIGLEPRVALVFGDRAVEAGSKMPLDDAELPFRELVDAAPDGVIVADAQERIVLVNLEAERMFGYARGELRGQPIEVLIPERVRPQHAGHVANYASAPRVRPMGIGRELVGRRKDGTELPIEISLAPIQTSNGLLVTAGIRDVTERRRLERDNRRAHAYLTSAVDAVPEAFALFDEDDRLVLINSSGRELFGASGGAVIGKTYGELLGRALRGGAFDFSSETREQLYERWLAYHHNPSAVLEVRTGTGRYLRVRSTRTGHGSVSLITDITDDVVHAEELRAAREAAEAASAAKSEFLSSMSHELRTPLNAILGFAQLLERDRQQPLPERQRERLQHVLRGGEHLLRLIDDVLDLSRIEAGRITISPEPVSARDVLEEVVAALEPMASRAAIAIYRPVKGVVEIPRVLADRTRLAQILMNFGSNAIKYGKPGGHVTFSIRASGTAIVRITVMDDGIGIPADKQAKVFEPFQRAGQEAGPIEGTGIGLSIAKRLAEMTMGRVGFSSEVGRGSEFWIEIPVHREAAGEGAAPTAPPGPSPLATGMATHKVVYIEDNPASIALMEDLLGELSAMKLLTAPTAEIGIELVRAHRPEVVIMDVNLPGISGFEAARRLRDSPETRDIPVIGLSAAALLRDTRRANEAGFYRYLTKPVNIDELTRVLEELLLRRN